MSLSVDDLANLKHCRNYILFISNLGINFTFRDPSFRRWALSSGLPISTYIVVGKMLIARLSTSDVDELVTIAEGLASPYTRLETLRMATAETFATVPPAPRLVNVEPNPGPSEFGHVVRVPLVTRPSAIDIKREAVREHLAELKNLAPKRTAWAPVAKAGINYDHVAEPVARAAPSKILTGVELNPGPGAKSSMKEKASFKLPNPFKKKKKAKKSQLGNSRSVGLSIAPLAIQTVGRNNTRASSFVVPFNSDAVFLTTPPSQPSLRFNSSDTAQAFQGAAICIHPIFPLATSTTTTPWKILGPQAYALATICTKWRIKSLYARYSSSSAATTVGHIALAYRPDCYTGMNTADQTYQRVSSTLGAVDGPLYGTGSPIVLRPNNLDTSWKYISKSSSTSSSDMRLASAGCLIVSSFGLASNASFACFGCLEIGGVLEFSDLEDNNTELGMSQIATTLVTSTTSDTTAAAPLGTTRTTVNNVNGYVTFPSGLIQFPKSGYYELKCKWTSTTGTITAPGSCVLSGSTATLVSSDFSATGDYTADIAIYNPRDPATGLEVSTSLTITGPTGMTAGDLRMVIKCVDNLRSSALVG